MTSGLVLPCLPCEDLGHRRGCTQAKGAPYSRPTTHLPPWFRPADNKIHSPYPNLYHWTLQASSLVSPLCFRASFLFLDPTACIPTSEPLHLLCPLPGALPGLHRVDSCL